MSFSATETLATLSSQHAELRERMDRCDGLVGKVETGACGVGELAAEVAVLRVAFEEHNRFEEQVLRPLLRRIDPYAAMRTERMIEDHVNEHRAMYDQLVGSDTALLRDVLETLRAHLEAEERYLLSPRVLRDDAHAD